MQVKDAPAIRERMRLLDGVDQAAIATDLAGSIVYWNRAAERLYGWAEHEVLGQNVIVVTMADRSPSYVLEAQARFAAGSPRPGEFRARTKDGRTFQAHVANAPIRNDTGELLGVLGLSSDLTARREAVEELTRLEAERREAYAAVEAERTRLQALLMQAPTAICVLEGPEHRFALLNQHYARILGPRRQVLGKSVREALPELEGQGFIELLDRVYTTGQRFVGDEMPALLDRGDGNAREQAYFNFVYEPTRNAEGEVDSIFVHAVDVTAGVLARQHAERLADAVAAERDRLRQVLDVLPEAVALADAATWTYVFSNAAHVLLTGTDLAGTSIPADGQPVPGSRRLDGTPMAAGDLPIVRSLRGEKIAGDRCTIQSALDGRVIPLLVNSAPICDAEGAVIGAVVVFQDISALRDLEHEKDLFLGTVSHDLQQPLTYIRGQAQLAQRRLARGVDLPPAQIAALLGGIEMTAGRMSEQIAALLDLTRLQFDQPLHLEIGEFDLVALVRQAVADQLSVSEDADRITFTTDHESLVSLVDGARIRRVLDNLLANAVKYSPNGGAIALALTVEQHEAAALEDHAASGRIVVLTVTDTGLGIPPADLPRVFERFHRGANVRDILPGTGLGLAGARQVVEQHGGSITAISTQGRGTTMTIRLPLRTRA